MPKKATPLTDKEVKNAKPKDKEYKLFDGNGLYLSIMPNGGKWWRVKYFFNGKENRLSLGTYPTVSLSKARLDNFELKKQIKEGINPSEVRAQTKREQAHKEALKKIEDKSQIHLIVKSWLNNYSKRVTPVTLKKETNRITNHILKPFSQINTEGFIISSKPISKITLSELSDILSDISNATPETADRLYSHCKGIWLYALSKGFIDKNIVKDISKQDTMAKVDNKHMPKITDRDTLKELLNAIDGYQNSIMIKQLLKLVCHIPLRAENISSLKWEYIDFEKRILTIPRNLMKVKNKNLPDFRLPLTAQVIEILQDTQKYFNHDVWVFPSSTKNNHHINKESPNKALKIMGFGKEPKKQTLHSFRGTFRSIADTYGHIHQATKEAKEVVLDHIEKNKSTLAYTNDADYTEQIKPLLEWWSNYLDEVKNG